MAKTRKPATAKLHATKNYGLFSESPDNRPVRLRQRRRLRQSMEKYGFLPAYPIFCRRVNRKLVIRDGQHRFALAQELGLPVFYVVLDTDIAIPDINSGQKPWNTCDYVECFAHQGNKHYRELLDFCDRHKMPLSAGMAMLYGHSNTNTPVSQMARDGEFAVRDRAMADRVANIYTQIGQLRPAIKTVNLVRAMYAACLIPDMDDQRLISGATRSPELLMRYSTRDGYLDMLERCYNFGRHKQVPLRIAAQNMLRSRNVGMPKQTREAAKTNPDKPQSGSRSSHRAYQEVAPTA